MNKKTLAQIHEEILAMLDPNLPAYSNLANAAALLYQMEDINWAGFYLVEGDVLCLGPFQGEVACMKIPFGKGVCGSSWKKKQTLIVEDVHAFPGHIACSSASKSEIVTPIIDGGIVVGVIDIDAPVLNRFHEEDALILEKIAKEIAKVI